MIDKSKFRLMDLELPKHMSLKTRLVLWWSDLIDNFTIWKWNRKHGR